MRNLLRLAVKAAVIGFSSGIILASVTTIAVDFKDYGFATAMVLLAVSAFMLIRSYSQQQDQTNHEG